jgi:hypothetical protein
MKIVDEILVNALDRALQHTSSLPQRQRSIDIGDDG